MKNILKEEINQIKYLFNYDRGKILSEQIDPEKKKEYQIKRQMVIDINRDGKYDAIVKYYDDLLAEKQVESPNTNVTNYIDSTYNSMKPDVKTKYEELVAAQSKQTPQTTDTSTPTLPKVKSEPNMPILGNLTGTDLTSAYNVLIGHFSNSKDFDGMAAFSTLLNNREKNTNMIELQKYLNSNTSVNLEQVYASISDKSGYENKGKGITKK